MAAPASALCALALALSGWLALALAMDRHRRQAPTVRLSPGALRSIGWLMLAAALWPCVAGWGWAIGATGWAGFISLAALLAAGLLTWAPRAAGRVSALLAPAACLATAFGGAF